MRTPDSFCIDVKRILVAHEFVLNNHNKCEYPNGRKYYGIVYCIDGKAEYVFSSGERCRICPGEILLLSPNAAYAIVTDTEFKHDTVNFEIHNEFPLIDFSQTTFSLFRTENAQWYHHIFKKIIAHWSSKKIGFQMQATACLYELFAFFGAELLEKEYSESSYLRLRPAKEYIEKNFASEINLDLLANCVNMSVTHFRREWLRLYGESPLRYRDGIRLSYAKEYLMSGYYTVTEVASKCGFTDTNYFIRFFEKHMGISPGKFMKIP